QVAFALREAPPGPTHDALMAIREQLDAATRQVNQMLALARADSMELRPEPVDLVALARDLTRQWWPRAREARIDLGFDTSEPTLTMAAQPGLLREALSNLLHNALRYTPAGGHVTVRVAAEAGEARLSVEDDGPGLPPEELARAGERFFRG
ncbi:MAG: HAMP domain-containing histidine kinase, partial [Ottowia sp.]|nr:HAMP domain-containing histidine kinase [Ottowia sp.]